MAVVRCRPTNVLGHSCHSARTPRPGPRNTPAPGSPTRRRRRAAAGRTSEAIGVHKSPLDSGPVGCRWHRHFSPEVHESADSVRSEKHPYPRGTANAGNAANPPGRTGGWTRARATGTTTQPRADSQTVGELECGPHSAPILPCAASGHLLWAMAFAVLGQARPESRVQCPRRPFSGEGLSTESGYLRKYSLKATEGYCPECQTRETMRAEM
jgi:hypothetical protein